MPSSFRTVLIADDDPTFLRLMGRYLTGSGIRIREARNVISARTILVNEQVHLICSDYDFGPGEPNGVDLLEEVGLRWPLVRRVLITGWADAAWVKRLPYLVVHKGAASMRSVAELLIMMARAP